MEDLGQFMKFVGGVTAVEVACLFLTKTELRPYACPIFCGITSIGILGALWKYYNEDDAEIDDDPEYASSVAEYHDLKPALDRKRYEQALVAAEWRRCSQVRDRFEDWNQESSALENRIANRMEQRERQRREAEKQHCSIDEVIRPIQDVQMLAEQQSHVEGHADFSEDTGQTELQDLAGEQTRIAEDAGQVKEQVLARETDVAEDAGQVEEQGLARETDVAEDAGQIEEQGLAREQTGVAEEASQIEQQSVAGGHADVGEEKSQLEQQSLAGDQTDIAEDESQTDQP